MGIFIAKIGAKRAKLMDSYSYDDLLKLFEKREFQIVVAIALDKHRAEETLRIAHDQFEKELKERTHDLEVLKRRYELILASAGEGIYGVDNDARVTFMNPAATKMLGWEQQELIGKSLHELIHYAYPDGSPYPKEECPIYSVFRNGRIHQMRDEVFFRKDGSSFPVEYTSTPKHESGRVIGSVVVFRDITERRHTEEIEHYLTQASKILGSSLDRPRILTSIAHLVVPRLADWCVIDIRDRDETIRRILVHRVPAKARWANHLIEKHRLKTMGPIGIENVLETNEPKLISEIHDLALAQIEIDPSFRAILSKLKLKSAMVVPILWHDQLLGAINFVSAESGRRYSDRDLNLAVELSNRVAMAIENSRLYAEVQEAVRLRDEFLSIASHELRTPLTSLYLQLQTFRRRAEVWKRSDFNRPFPLKEILENIETAIKQIKRMGNLVDELLDITRIRLGRLELHKEELDVVALIEEIIVRMNPALIQSGSRISFDKNEQLIGNWDRARLEQVLINLISNGIKYGEGKPIEISARKRDEKIIIRVTDHGMGIPKKEQKRIFERFERVMGSSGLSGSNNISGLGLGLYISRQIIEAHEGSISLESELGKGSIFTVVIPLSKNQEIGEFEMRKTGEKGR